MYNSLTFGILTVVQSSPRSILESFYYPHFPQPQAITNLPSVSIDTPTLDISCKWITYSVAVATGSFHIAYCFRIYP